MADTKQWLSRKPLKPANWYPITNFKSRGFATRCQPSEVTSILVNPRRSSRTVTLVGCNETGHFRAQVSEALRGGKLLQNIRVRFEAGPSERPVKWFDIFLFLQKMKSAGNVLRLDCFNHRGVIAKGDWGACCILPLLVEVILTISPRTPDRDPKQACSPNWT